MDVNWSGWELQNNEFDKEFDESARIRMIEGGKYLHDLLSLFELGKNILEIGPFFTPTPVNLRGDQNLIYLENDPHAIKMLRSKYSTRKNISVIEYDISNLGTKCFLNTRFNSSTENIKFDTVILSQVLNYVDYVSLFNNIKPYLNPKCKLFINNVVNYGIPPYFHKKRPGNSNEIVKVLIELGFKIIKLEQKPAPREKDDDRLLLVSEYLTDA